MADVALRSIGQIYVPVEDLRRATTFYRDTLGTPFLFEVPRMAFFDLDGIRLMLGERDGDQDGTASIVYFDVDDLEETHEALKGRGVEFQQGPTLIAEMEGHDLWMAFFQDSEGNQLALMSERAKP
jgi:predicted enzyme related to lactoylglutathione lyase